MVWRCQSKCRKALQCTMKAGKGKILKNRQERWGGCQEHRTVPGWVLACWFGPSGFRAHPPNSEEWGDRGFMESLSRHSVQTLEGLLCSGNSA